MGKIILTFAEIIDLNQYLMDKGLNFKVHLHDRCGSQSFTIETIGDEELTQMDAVKKVIIEYFSHKKITLKFSENMMEFSIIQ